MTTGDVDPQSGQSGGETEASPPPPADQEPGGLGLRFAARLIDSIIIFIVAVAIGIVLNMLVNYRGNAFVFYLINGIITGVITFVYFVAFESSQGWTPGKKVLGLNVRGPGGAPRPTPQQSAIRNVWTLVSIVPPQIIGGALYLIAVIGIAVTINNSPTKQGIHDKLAGGTQVVKG